MARRIRVMGILVAAGVVTMGSLGVVAAQQGSFGMWGHPMGGRMTRWNDSDGAAMTGCSSRGHERGHNHGRNMIDGRRGCQMRWRGGRSPEESLGGTLPPAGDNLQGQEDNRAPTAFGDADQGKLGRSLLANMGCQSCHQLGTSGGHVGPSLNGVVSRRGEEFVRTKLADPRFNNSSSRMPDFGLSAGEIEAIVSYLATLDGA